MKARDGDTQTKKGPQAGAIKTGGAAGSGRCPSCDTVVPAKPGFRLSTLKCPKCGAQLGKQ